MSGESTGSDKINCILIILLLLTLSCLLCGVVVIRASDIRSDSWCFEDRLCSNVPFL